MYQGDRGSNDHCLYYEGRLFAELKFEREARRIVACWNLLHNVPVEMMERWVEQKKANPNASHFEDVPAYKRSLK